MTSALASWRPPAPIDRVINRWFDAGRGDHALWVVLGLFVAIWTSFQIISYASVDLHFDLVEAFAWSRHLAGYKHPPLTAIIVRAWFSIFPIADWSFHLLAMLNAAVAFFAVDLIARRYLDGDKRLLVLLLLLLTPFYQFHGQRFNSNAILLSTWPIATYCFLRSFETRTVLWSAAAGAAAALAMLGKYYSIFLIAGFVVAALFHPRRLGYLRSSAPWVSTFVGLAVLAPHLHWLVSTGAPTLDYAFGLHGHQPLTNTLWKLMPYVAGAIGYVGLPILVYLLIVRPDRRTLVAALWPSDPDRRMIVILFVVPLVLPALVSPLIGVTLTPLWTMPAWFLLPIVLLAPQEAVVTRIDAVRVAFVVLCISLVVLVASPAVAWSRHVYESERRYRGHYAAVGHALTNEWRRAIQRPLTIVTGEYDVANAVSFYSADHPEAFNLANPRMTPWITEARRRREGWAAVCPAARADCLALVDQAVGNAGGAVRAEFEHSASFLGRPNPPVRFIFVLMPPKP